MVYTGLWPLVILTLNPKLGPYGLNCLGSCRMRMWCGCVWMWYGCGVDTIISSHQLQPVLLHLITFDHSGHISEAPARVCLSSAFHVIAWWGLGTGQGRGACSHNLRAGPSRTRLYVDRSYEKDLSSISASCSGSSEVTAPRGDLLQPKLTASLSPALRFLQS